MQPATYSASLRAGRVRGVRVTYFTDGTHLYEIAAQQAVQNHGLRRGIIRYVILRDCVSEATATIDELQLAALSEVR